MKKIIALIIFIFTQNIFAVPTLTNLTKENTEKVVKDFGVNFVHTSISPASGAKGFGFQLGVLAGATESPGLNELVEEKVGYLPHAGALGILYLPAGFGGEYLLVPKTKYQGLTFENQSAAFRWTPTEIFSPNGFIAFRLRGFYGDVNLSYSQTINDIPIGVFYRSFSYGGEATLSFQNIPYFEPYFGFGYITLDSKLKGEGSASLFNRSYTTSEQVQVEQSGPLFLTGFNIRYSIFVFGAEYSKIIDNTRMSVKLALEFTPHGVKGL
jgi:hypothetical protein